MHGADCGVALGLGGGDATLGFHRARFRLGGPSNSLVHFFEHGNLLLPELQSVPALLGVEPRLRLLRLCVCGEKPLLDRGHLLSVATLAIRRERELPLEVVAPLDLGGVLTGHESLLFRPGFPLPVVLALGGLEVQVLLVVHIFAARGR